MTTAETTANTVIAMQPAKVGPPAAVTESLILPTVRIVMTETLKTVTTVRLTAKLLQDAAVTERNRATKPATTVLTTAEQSALTAKRPAQSVRRNA